MEPAGTDLRVCGFGRNDTQKETIPKVLMETTFEEPQNTSKCRFDHICPAVSERRHSICMGDSGGPLYAMKGGKVKCLYGVTSLGVSRGTGDCNTGINFFANVPHFYDWILEAEKSFGELLSSSENHVV